MGLPISIFIMIAVCCVLTAILYWLRYYAKQKQFRPPLARDLPRNPGQALLAELNWINKDIRRYCAFAVLSPLIILAVHFAQTYFAGAEQSGTRLVVSAGGGLSLCLFSTYKIFKLRNARKNMRLGYQDELEVARQLEPLARDGFHVHHGFSAQTFSIDHVVVGPKGVFSIETKSHPRAASKNRLEDATVEYDGRMLFFPKDEDLKTVDQAQQQACWLSEWLSKAIGEEIAARAIVALPGWFVKRTSAEGIPVVNPQQFASLFKHIKPRPLPDSMIMRINHQLNQKYRNPIF